MAVNEHDSESPCQARWRRSWRMKVIQSDGRRVMPAKSRAQQMAAGAALAARRGEQKASELEGAARSMYDSMSEEELEKMASTSREGKPRHDNQSDD